MIPASILEKAKNIQLVVTDIDGVWTDATIYYSAEGEVLKAFSYYDGMGTYMLRQSNIKVAIITGENSPIVLKRAAKLGIEDVYLGVRDKLAILEELLQKYELDLSQVAYIGDDVNDLGCMQVAGLTAAPANTPAFHLLEPDVLLQRSGGDGAFREFADLILAARE